MVIQLNPRNCLCSFLSRCCTRENSLWIFVHRSPFHQYSAREQHVLFCYFNLRSVCVVPASGVISGRSGHLLHQDRQFGKSFVWLSVMQVLDCLSCRCGTLSMVAWDDSPSSSTVWGGSQHCSNRLLVGKASATNLGSWRTIEHRHRGLPKALPSSRNGVRLQQPTPAEAATDQPHFPDSSRLVRR